MAQESLTDIAEKQIYAYLKKHSYKPGDAFLGEEELAEKFKISRPVIREALSRLKMLGFLESRKRRGMIVSSPPVFETMKKIIDPAFLEEKAKKEFYNLRVIIELGLAEILAFNVSDDDIERLEEIVKKEESNPASFELYMKCDYAFHMQIYKATKCSALKSFQTLLYRNFEKGSMPISSRMYAKRFEDPDQSSHRDVLEAIKTRIPNVIQSAMREHMEYPLTIVKKATN